jgi:hypothetical protein
MIEGSGSGVGTGSESIPLTNGSGSESSRPKNTWIRWIRIRIRNTAVKCLEFFEKIGKERKISMGRGVGETQCKRERGGEREGNGNPRGKRTREKVGGNETSVVDMIKMKAEWNTHSVQTA